MVSTADRPVVPLHPTLGCYTPATFKGQIQPPIPLRSTQVDAALRSAPV